MEQRRWCLLWARWRCCRVSILEVSGSDVHVKWENAGRNECTCVSVSVFVMQVCKIVVSHAIVGVIGWMMLCICSCVQPALSEMKMLQSLKQHVEVMCVKWERFLENLFSVRTQLTNQGRALVVRACPPPSSPPPQCGVSYDCFVQSQHKSGVLAGKISCQTTQNRELREATSAWLLIAPPVRAVPSRTAHSHTPFTCPKPEKNATRNKASLCSVHVPHDPTMIVGGSPEVSIGHSSVQQNKTKKLVLADDDRLLTYWVFWCLNQSIAGVGLLLIVRDCVESDVEFNWNKECSQNE